MDSLTIQRALLMSRILLGGSALFSVGLMVLVSGSRFDFRIVLFAIWAVLPYFLLYLIITSWQTLKSRAAFCVSACVSSFFLTIPSACLYCYVLFIDTSSTSGLVFLSGPCIMLIGGPLAFFACYLTLRRFLADQTMSHFECSRCNYDLRLNQSGICPECGTPIPEDQKQAIALTTKSM